MNSKQNSLPWEEEEAANLTINPRKAAAAHLEKERVRQRETSLEYVGEGKRYIRLKEKEEGQKNKSSLGNLDTF